MPSLKAPHALSFPSENRILAALPKDEYARLLPAFSHTRLPQGRMLWDVGDRIRHAFFPLGGMVSLISVTEDESTVEVGMIGSEGCAGVSALLRLRNAPYRVVSQLQTGALRIGIEALEREFLRGGRLQDLLLRYTHVLLAQVSQSASCNRFHTTEERLCRWLLISSDRARSDTLDLTQGFLSEMIGCPRTSVTAIAARIQRMGLVRYSRGRVHILDRAGLERVSCECYRVISKELHRFLAA
jgi:CRP-like cAMP-binding protein